MCFCFKRIRVILGPMLDEPNFKGGLELQGQIENNHIDRCPLFEHTLIDHCRDTIIPPLPHIFLQF